MMVLNRRSSEPSAENFITSYFSLLNWVKIQSYLMPVV
jgi:hypothetical protein